MNAAVPTARSALPFFEFRNRSFDVFLSGLRVLYGDNPAYPLIAGERRDIFPGRKGFRVRNKRPPHIGRQAVDDAPGNPLRVHTGMLPNPR